MNRYAFAFVVLISALAAGVARADDDDFVPAQVLVRLADGVSIAQIHGDYGTTTPPGAAVPSRRLYVLQMPEAGNESSLVDLLLLDPRIEHAELNFLGGDTNPNGTTQSIFLGTVEPIFLADASFALIRGHEAHAIASGAGITVAIIDSGVDAGHPFLAGRVLAGAGFVPGDTGTNDSADGIDSNDNGVADEMAGHGTMVAGLVARTAPQASILPVRVMDSDGVVTLFSLVQGIYYAIDQGAQVLQVSITIEADALLLADAVAEAQAAGRLLVAAAGNESSSNPFFPAAAQGLGVVGVAATDTQDVRADFSNYGPWIDLAAPGVAVATTIPGGGYGLADGTSFAAPFVSGVAALVWSRCPSASAEHVRRIMQESSVVISAINPSYAGTLGAGRIDAAAAATQALCDCEGVCIVDFDRSDSVDDIDIREFFLAFEQGTPCADVNSDDAVDDLDITAFFQAFEAGC